MEFHENPTKRLVAEARSQAGDRSVSSYRTENNVAYKNVRTSSPTLSVSLVRF
jgi:hypothetical protein